MKHRLYRIFVSLALVLSFGVLIWTLTLHGAIAMLGKDSLIRGIFASGMYGFADVSIDGHQASIVFRGPQNQEIKSFTLNKK